MGFKPTSGGGIDQLTGEVTAGPGTGSQSATIAPVTTAGSIGGATAVPEITYNDAGQITGVASVAPNDISKVPLATVTAAGDLIVGSGAGAVSRLGIGADGDVLTVAAGALGYAAPSDLLQFFQSTLPSSQSWSSVAYGNGAFVAVAYGSAAAAYSTDGGHTWTASTLPSSQSWYSVAYGNGAFVAVAYGSAAAYSTDGGHTWTASTLPSSQSWYSVAYGNGAFVAVTNGSAAAAYSTDGGVSWTAATLPSSQSWMSVAYGNGAFVAVTFGSAAAYTQVVALTGANTATVTAPSVTSGSAFTPSTASNSTVYFQINAASAGSYTLTMGPTTGAENTVASSVAMVAGSDALVTLVVPRSWLVVLTLTTVTLSSTTVVAI